MKKFEYYDIVLLVGTDMYVAARSRSIVGRGVCVGHCAVGRWWHGSEVPRLHQTPN